MLTLNEREQGFLIGVFAGMLVAYPVKTIEVAIQMLGEDGTESLLAKLDLLKE